MEDALKRLDRKLLKFLLQKDWNLTLEHYGGWIVTVNDKATGKQLGSIGCERLEQAMHLIFHVSPSEWAPKAK
jgi:hypothetical protein